MRFLLLNAFVAVFSILCCIYAIILSLFDRRGGGLLHRHAAVPWAKGVLWVCGVRVRVLGEENLDPGTARMYVCNHQSYFDIFALLAGLPVQFKFVLKEELMKIPFLGPAMKRAGYIGIDRDDPRKALKGMNEAAERIKKGASVLVFPEGTRSSDGRIQPFKPGAFHMALKSRSEIVPLAIVGSRLIVPKGSLTIRRGTITLHIGRPISVAGYARKDMDLLIEKVRGEMLDLMARAEGGDQEEARDAGRPLR
jgi:1-acyl-sn-glycerol-3-phosphate acyltransferase